MQLDGESSLAARAAPRPKRASEAVPEVCVWSQRGLKHYPHTRRARLFASDEALPKAAAWVAYARTFEGLLERYTS